MQANGEEEHGNSEYLIQKHSHLNWSFWIPILIWGGCTVMGFIRLSGQQVDRIHAGEAIDIFQRIIEFIEVNNSNAFATFISFSVMKWYQFDSAPSYEKAEQSSGLPTDMVPWLIIASIIYLVLFVLDSAWHSHSITIVLFAYSVVYIALYFKKFSIDKWRTEE